MEKIKKGQKPEGRDVMSSSYDNWDARLTDPANFTKRINDTNAKGK